jgi:hypothetical protein
VDGAVLDILLQEHRDIRAATSFFVRLLRAYDVPKVIDTDKLWGGHPGTLQKRGGAIASPDTAAGTQPGRLQATTNSRSPGLTRPNLEPLPSHPNPGSCTREKKSPLCSDAPLVGGHAAGSLVLKLPAERVSAAEAKLPEPDGVGGCGLHHQCSSSARVVHDEFMTAASCSWRNGHATLLRSLC